MLKLKRPEMPPGFSQDVLQVKTEIAQKIGQLIANPQPVSKKQRRVKILDFPEIWKDYKVHFTQAQHEKCGYCEVYVTPGQSGDVEHYAPKGDVRELDDYAPGHEVPFSSSVEGRKTKVLSQFGYWWLAYDWSNYLLSCSVCNQRWKGAIFPVQEKPRTIPPSQATQETPLLLNPYSDIDPGQHLRFSDFGQIEACGNSLFGKETIRTCGLDRDSLVKARREKSKRAYQLVRALSQAVKSENRAEIKKVLRDFYEMGREEYEFAGMVRIIFVENCGICWKDLEDLIN